MTSFAVYLPPQGTPLEQAERARLIPERGSIWALLVPPLWIISRRLWLVLALWIIAMIALAWFDAGLHLAGAGVISLLFAVWFALSARDLEQATLIRSGWRLADVVEAGSATAAEQLFFARWQPETSSAPRHGRVTGFEGLTR